MVGIHGIGKTTVARAVYNFIADQFEGLCFLENVRENSIKHGLVHLQETLLYDILGKKDIKLGSVYKGIPVIKHRLHRKKVLLVLDDVDKLDQLRAIVGESSWFGLGSRVIITTRDKHLLTSHGVGKTYEVDGLNMNEALELICWNAFKTDKVDSNYENVLNRAVSYASGLPLALEVMGSYLVRKSIKEWESAIDQFERIPDEKIHNILKVSFVCLSEDQQKIFLDIACFFKGYDLSYVKKILQIHHGICPEYGIGVLIEKSLIKITLNGRVILHDLIEDMGKEIVRQESPEKPGKRSRLWFHEDIIHVFEENTGTSSIQVIILDFPNFEEVVEWDGKAFKEMKNLKILIIRVGGFSRGPDHLPNSLRVLEWWGYPSPSLPSNFHPKKLVILELPQSCLMSLDLLIPKKKFVNMRVLNFDDCEFITEIPDVSGAPNLEELSFGDCKNLIKIHESVGFLNKLKMLNADGCSRLGTFPPIKLSSLEKLKLSSCHSLKSFPEILGKMEHITVLDLLDTPIKELPFTIHNLTRLERVVLIGCGIVQLPSSIFGMPELHELIAGECTMLLPKQDNFEAQASSMVLNLGLSGCHVSDDFLRIGLPLFSNIKELYLSQNEFTTLPACIKDCYFLTKIHLDGCKNLKKICGVPLNLETLSAKWCTSLKNLDLTLLPKCVKLCHFLKTLILDNCKNLKKIRGVPPNIRTLSARDCPSLNFWCRSVLQNEKLHAEGGDKEFHLPETCIPMWFTHHVYGHDASITFWFRKKVPAISLCLVVRPGTYEEIIHPRFIINGDRKTDVCEQNIYDGDRVCNRVVDHIIIFDIKSIPIKLTDVIFESEWNHVLCTLSGLRNKLFIDEIGIRVFKQGINMEDIRFTNPHLLKDKYRSIYNRVLHGQPMMHVEASLDKLLRLLPYRYFYYLAEYGHSIFVLYLCFIFLDIVSKCIEDFEYYIIPSCRLLCSIFLLYYLIFKSSL
ncbi:unnamed protein product [Trifolium pratense]|uniref:Uncharacterized protein n=1 Tax=Trifolium pratense TaxID=57577 RepID=A0ACB0LAE1_TRIPR|nr:unnamed protein product [Trifolium pratense]